MRIDKEHPINERKKENPVSLYGEFLYSPLLKKRLLITYSSTFPKPLKLRRHRAIVPYDHGTPSSGKQGSIFCPGETVINEQDDTMILF